MQFKINNNQVFFRDFDLSEYMTIKEVNVNTEDNEAFVTAEFKASVDIKSNGFMACMVADMSEENRADLMAELESLR